MLLASALMHVPPLVSFLHRVWRKPLPRSDEHLPRTAVILCLRGADSTLERCVEGLLTQDYPCYDVVIIVDNVNDPAWEFAQRFVSRERKRPDEQPRVRIETLINPSDRCSLKCSSLVQAIDGLDESCEVIALLDADTSPYLGWLRELVSSLTAADVGATTGVRWHMPSQPSWPSIVRYQWGMASVLACNTLSIGWGGTMAIKLDAFRRAGLREKWASAYCEDTMVTAELGPLGLRLRYLPYMVLVNRESCTLDGFFEWCTRQMLTTQLYHRAWPLVLVHGLFSVLVWLVPFLLAIWTAATRQWNLLAWLTTALAAYWIVHWLGMLLIEKSLARLVVQRGEPADWLGWTALWRSFVCVPLTQMIYGAVLLNTLRVRHVRWRGIDYEITGPFSVRRGEYKPYGQNQ
jgi:cellulose synthase/poly-beta-1,6-N-acetylglucosamine synthase-like glycosyltransferase